MTIIGQNPEDLKRKLLDVTAEVFVPYYDKQTQDALLNLPGGADGFRVIEKSGYNYDARTAARLRLFLHTTNDIRNGFEYWFFGVQDDDALITYPAQELILIINDAWDKTVLPGRWKLAGGKNFGGRMIAAKWDSIWSKISVFNFPFPPFNLKSGYGVRDIAFTEAKAFGLILPKDFKASMNLNVDMDDFRARLSKQLDLIEKKTHL